MTDDGKPGIRFTSQIVVTPRKGRTDLPAFCIEGRGGVLDLRPLAAEVLADYPTPVALDVDILADFAVRRESGKYIRVGDYPPGVARNLMDQLASRVLRWGFWQGAPAKNQGFTVFPFRRFVCGEGACRAAREIDGQQVLPEGIRRLPLSGCWDHVCTCRYRLVRRDGRLI